MYAHCELKPVYACADGGPARGVQWARVGASFQHPGAPDQLQRIWRILCPCGRQQLCHLPGALNLILPASTTYLEISGDAWVSVE